MTTVEDAGRRADPFDRRGKSPTRSHWVPCEHDHMTDEKDLNASAVTTNEVVGTLATR